jgi:hypothetical protein
MKYGIIMREYKGMYFVEFNSKSVGCTLLATWDKSEAEAEYKRFSGMSNEEMIAYLNRREVATK